MKNIINKLNKTEILKSFLTKTTIYLLWYICALLFLLFVTDNTSKMSLIALSVIFVSLFIIRNFFKDLYNKNRKDTYYNIKHTVELHLFEKIKDMRNEDLYELDKETLSNKILQFTYNFTKIYSDIENCIVPFILGGIILFVVTASVSIALSLLLIIAIIAAIVFRYKYIVNNESDNWVNYNDLLKDFLSKIVTIKKFNLFGYCIKKLDSNSNNDLVVINDNYKDDTIFNNILYALCLLIAIVLIIKLDSFSILGHMMFYGFMLLKLKTLVYRIIPCISNILTTYNNYNELLGYFKNNVDRKYISSFKRIEINEMKYDQKSSDCSITVNNLEIEKGDSISIMGKPGQGKSVILNVLSGMYKLDKGSILVDDKEINGLLDVAFISACDDIFNLTLRENLSLGTKVSDELILQYIDEANLAEWFGLLPDGLDTILDERYVEITTSDKIKLNIIRSIVLDKQLYLIDDFCDYLNIESEKALAEMIKKYLRKKTFVIVAHKPIFTTICKKHYFIKNHTLLEKETLL